MLGLARSELEQLFVTLEQKPFRAQQLMKWMYHHGITDFDAMTNLSKSLREQLQASYEIRLPELVQEFPSEDGTIKWVLRMTCGNAIETVFIPEKTRGTLCVSSQVGCTLNCRFCSTATQGFNRNLSVAEIVGQVLFAVKRLGIPENIGHKKVTNIVLMGMGEPLVNFDNVVPAIQLMLDDCAFGLSKRRVTLSTAGMVPAIHALREKIDVSLAVSLHAPNDEIRDQIVPLNKKHPIRELLQACKAYLNNSPHRRITFEYVMLKNVNDSDENAHELARLLKQIPSKINLIPFNPFPGTKYECSSGNRIKRFQDILINAGYSTMVRRTRGDDVNAACGQLVGQVADRTRRQEKWQREVKLNVGK